MPDAATASTMAPATTSRPRDRRRGTTADDASAMAPLAEGSCEARDVPQRQHAELASGFPALQLGQIMVHSTSTDQAHRQTGDAATAVDDSAAECRLSATDQRQRRRSRLGLA